MAQETNNQQIERGDLFMAQQDLPPPPELKGVPGAEDVADGGRAARRPGTSVMVAEVAPGEGPPLHLHFTEEVQYVIEGSRLDFVIGDKRLTVTEPGVVHIPAGAPHAFVNRGDAPMRVVTFFPTPCYEINWKNLGPNPLTQG